MAVAVKRVSRKYGAFERFLLAKREELMAHLADPRQEMVADRVPDDSYGLASRTLIEDMTADALEREHRLLGGGEAGRGGPGGRGAFPGARFWASCGETRRAYWKN